MPERLAQGLSCQLSFNILPLEVIQDDSLSILGTFIDCIIFSLGIPASGISGRGNLDNGREGWKSFCSFERPSGFRAAFIYPWRALLK